MAEEEIDLTDDGYQNSDMQAQLLAIERELGETEAEISLLLERQSHLRAERDRIQRVIQAEQRAPRADWTGESFAWTAKAQNVLETVFKLQSYRPLQREVINATLQGRDVLCLLPSGGGKSLCYQLPALVSEGLTLVVSPLLSLIQDQVAGLKAVGVEAASLTSVTTKEENAHVMRQLDQGTLRLLYCTPEKVINSKRFMSKLEKVYKANRLARVAIDEAHCCSQWGNDFRPDYKKLGVLKQQFPTTPTIALTATATHQVCEDLKSTLRLDGCEFFRSSINRPNLRYEVCPKPVQQQDLSTHIAALITSTYPSGESGIVYCLTRKDTEVLAEELRQAGLRAVAYHADMEPAVRESAHSAWSSGSVQVIVATIAFGMGINKPDVRFVIHHCLSKSIENYYQESGRAGRDGLPARCILYYRFADVLRLAGVVCYESGWQGHLMAMLRYASDCGQCRRAMLQQHFSEAPAECRATCDVCAAAAAAAAASPSAGAASTSGKGHAAGQTAAGQQDVTGTALELLTALQAFIGKGKNCTLVMLLDAWAKKGRSRELGERVAALLALQGLVQLDFGITAYATNVYLKPTSKGVGFLEAAGAGRKPLVLAALPGAAAVGGDGACEEAAAASSSQRSRAGAASTTGRGRKAAAPGSKAAAAPASRSQAGSSRADRGSAGPSGGVRGGTAAAPAPVVVVDSGGSDSDGDWMPLTKRSKGPG